MLKVHSLTGRITESLMHKAFKAVKKNRGAAGIDKVSIKMFEQNLEENLMALMKRMKDGTYMPYPLRREYIPKDKTQLRPLGIPAVCDRVAQEVIRRLIEPYFEPCFSKWSYGFRPNRNCHQAIRRIIELRKQGYACVLDADIKAFFDNIPHELIMKLVAAKIADGNILSIISKFLKSGVMEAGVFMKTLKGTPQGGVISPLLANIVLDVLDKKLAVYGYAFVRYADDFLVLAKSAAEIEKVYDLVRTVIEDELGLELSKEKTKITSFIKEFDFLGFHFSRCGITIRTKSVEKMKDKIRDMTIRSHNFSDDLVEKINRVTRGYANYYATDFSKVKIQFTMLDETIRRRLRSMKTKRITPYNNRKIPIRFFEKHGLFALCSAI
ncbi:MAG: group II intron reverse transcriptase/maturase [Methanosarcinaceae archaeon]